MRQVLLVSCLVILAAVPLLAQDETVDAAQEQPISMLATMSVGWGQVSTTGGHGFANQSLDRMRGLNHANGPVLGLKLEFDNQIVFRAGVHRYDSRGYGRVDTDTTLYTSTFGGGTATSTRMKYRQWFVGLGIKSSSNDDKSAEFGLRARFWRVNTEFSGLDPLANPVSDSDSWGSTDLSLYVSIPIRSGKSEFGLDGEISFIPINYLFSSVVMPAEADGPSGEDGYRSALTVLQFNIGFYWEYPVADNMGLRLGAYLHLDYQESDADEFLGRDRDIPSWVGGWLTAGFSVRF